NPLLLAVVASPALAPAAAGGLGLVGLAAIPLPTAAAAPVPALPPVLPVAGMAPTVFGAAGAGPGCLRAGGPGPRHGPVPHERNGGEPSRRSSATDTTAADSRWAGICATV